MKALLIQRGGVIQTTLPDTNDDDRLQAMYDLIACRYVEGGGVPAPGHAAWVDDEGLFVIEDGHETITTLTTWHQQPLAGKILITGLSELGETTEATLSVADVYAMIVSQQVHNEVKPS